MSAYEALAGVYDALTEDVGYERRADYLEKLFRRGRVPVRTVLDLACGTGEMTAILTERGYELIAVDGSPDMLARAREKAAAGVPEPGYDGVGPLRDGGRRCVLSGQSELSSASEGCAKMFPAAPSVRRAGGRAGI